MSELTQSLGGYQSSYAEKREKSLSQRLSLTRKSKSQQLEDENKQLRLLLDQSLRREGDAQRKLKHLQEMYQILLYKSYGKRFSSRQSDTSEESILVVCTPTEQIEQQQEMEPVGYYGPQDQLSFNKPTLITAIPPAVTEHDDDENIESNGSDIFTTTTTSLAPLPAGLRDVRYEREKPPISNSKEVKNIKQPVAKTNSGSPDLSTLASKRSTLSKQRSRSDEMLNMHQRERSNTISHLPNGLTNNIKRKSFWKRKVQVYAETGNMSSEYDQLFQNFLRTASLSEDPLKKYLGVPWSFMCNSNPHCSKDEEKYRDAVWELFQEEAKYLTRQLIPLEQIYKGFLEELQFHGKLCHVKIDKIFANLSQLIELSSSIANDLLKLFQRSSSIAHPNELILSFNMFGHKFNPIYLSFCTNYELQRIYTKKLTEDHEFQEYLRVCRTAPSVQKNDLTDLLIAPMQHQCHYQLLLEKVLKRTQDPNHRSVLASTIKAFVVSLKELESAITRQKCSVELLELNEMIQWPCVSSRCTDTYIPCSLLEHTNQQLSTLVSPDRHLKYQGDFKLLDYRGRATLDLHIIVFNDLLLVTEIKNGQQKKDKVYSVLYQPYQPSLLSLHCPVESARPIIILIPLNEHGYQLTVISLLAANGDDRDALVTSLTELNAHLL